MSKKTSSLSNRFAKRAHDLELTRAKAENLLLANSINVADIEQVYAGLFLDIFTEFEALIEDLFLGLLMGRLYSPSQSAIRKVRFMRVCQT